ncbi:MAG TPA: hypothetical protein VGH15_05210 [Caulobacteraceae bacterium]
MRRTQLLLFAAAGAMSVLASARPAGAAKELSNPKVIQNLLDCRKLTDNAERLACYDREAAAVQTATSSGDLVTIDREQRRAARRQAFGFSLPSLAFLERGEKAGEVNHLTAQAAEVSQDPFGKWVIKLDDGAVWTQTEPEMLARRPRKGSSVVLSRGALGGYFMTIDGQGAGKAKRVS